MIVYDSNVTGGAPVKSWASDLDANTLDQVSKVAQLPFVHKYVSLMPDAHYGFGVPIGCVLPCVDYVIPNAVGNDIGCGMCAFSTGIGVDYFNDGQLDDIMRLVNENIPTGKSSHATLPKNSHVAKADALVHRLIEETRHGKKLVDEYGLENRAPLQIGTLGDGNHFVELQKSSSGELWIMIHSGSRGFGGSIADYYHRMAKRFCEVYFSNIPTLDLAFLSMDTVEGRDYFQAMSIATEYAFENRKAMMHEVVASINAIMDEELIDYDDCADRMINIHHNYASIENHFRKNVVVHRKGATLARTGITGIIPGSMTTRSYIVKGKGNPESFHSCSHGSGRICSRRQAKELVSTGAVASRQSQIANAGIQVYGSSSYDDELGSAYKKIEDVMKNQEDLVEIKVELSPISVLKG